jgi:hypothetical protein
MVPWTGVEGPRMALRTKSIGLEVFVSWALRHMLSHVACGLLGIAVLSMPALAQPAKPVASAPSTITVVTPSAGIVRAQRASQGGRSPASGNYRWEIEVHGGGVWDSGSSSSGTPTLPAPGETFVTAFGSPTRRISSWYFGDGAALFNAFPSQVRGGQSLAGLDPVLGASPGRKPGGAFGARVGYRLTPRLSAEFTVDYGSGALKLDDDTLAQIEASRASFVTVWNAALNPFGGARSRRPPPSLTKKAASSSPSARPSTRS